MTSFKIPPLTLEIVDDDIAAQTTDAIVNAANNAFWMGSGVAGAIKSRGGKSIEDEAMAQGPVEPGLCVLTSAGRLRTKHVIHAAVMGQDLQTSAPLIEMATRNALRLAESHRLTSIAMPAFGTGVGGFSVVECARIMIDVVQRHATVVRERATTTGSLRLVRFVLFGQASYEAFDRIARETVGSA